MTEPAAEVNGRIVSHNDNGEALMSEDKLSFLDEPVDAPEPVETIETPVAEPAAEAAPTVQRDEKGRFAPIEGKGEPESAPPAPEPEKTHTIPPAVALDERKKRQAIERERDEYRREADEYRRKLDEMSRPRAQPQAQPEAPDIITDPDGYRDYMAHQIRRETMATKLEVSRFLAEDKYGPELVQEAFEYFNANPQGTTAFLSKPSPFHAAVEHYRNQKALSEIGPDPEAYRSKLREEIAAEIRAEMTAPAPAPARPSAPPASLASAPSAGSNAIAPRGNAFDAAFPR